MKPFLFKNGSKTFDRENQIISLTDGERYRSVTSFTKGSWYSEITHIEGDNYHFFGILCDCGALFYYPENYVFNKPITVRDCLSDDGTYQRKEIPFSIPPQSVVGIGINFVNNLFSIFYDTNFYTFQYKSPPKNTKFSIYFGEGIVDQKYDKIKLNFGTKPLQYNIPSIATIFSNLQRVTIHITLSFPSLSSFLFMIFIHDNC